MQAPEQPEIEIRLMLVRRKDIRDFSRQAASKSTLSLRAYYTRIASCQDQVHIISCAFASARALHAWPWAQPCLALCCATQLVLVMPAVPVMQIEMLWVLWHAPRKRGSAMPTLVDVGHPARTTRMKTNSLAHSCWKTTPARRQSWQSLLLVGSCPPVSVARPRCTTMFSPWLVHSA